MASSFRKSLVFGPLRVMTPRSHVSPAGGLRGIRIPVGPRGIYVGFGPGGIGYQSKLDQTALMPISPEGAVRDLQSSLTKTNLFKAYLWTSAVVLLFCLATPSLFVVLGILLGIGGIFVHRWDRDRCTARIFFDVDSDELVSRLALCNVAGEALARAARLWHVFSASHTFASKYHAGANRLVGRVPTRSVNYPLDDVDLNIDCWSLPVGGRQLMFLPDRLLVRVGSHLTAVPYETITATHSTKLFVEEDAVPPDARVVDTTWRFVNKSGGPDRRFNNNRQLPVAEYGELVLRAANGEEIVIQASNPLATQHAAIALQELARIARTPAQAALPPAPPPAPSPPVPSPQNPPYRAPPRVVNVPPAPPPPPNPFLPASPNPWPQPQVRFAPHAQRPPPPPVRFLRPRPRTEIHAPSVETRFLGPTDTLNVAGRAIRNPLTYASVNASGDIDASTVVTSLPVGDASRAGPLPYWPRYSEADADQRARYLDWMMAGRTDRSIAMGYVFIFFYGLERRVLIDGADEALAGAEVTRLLGIYGENHSFRRYASDFLAFMPLRRAERLMQMTQSEVSEHFEALVADSLTGLAAVLGWHHAQQKPLAADHAARVVQGMEDAKRGVVVSRSAAELLDLFKIRYRETFGEGILLDAAKRPLSIQYHPASPSLLERGRQLTASVPNVLGRPGQFRKVVSLWNDCVDDLRKASARKGGARQLDAAAWAALPIELRAEYDHPDQDKWDSAVAATPLLAGFHLIKAGELAKLHGFDDIGKVTAAQMKKVALRAADVGYAIEPEPRLRSKAVDTDADVLIWRTPATEPPDAKIYGAVFAMLSLAMTVALADGVFSQEEQDVVNAFLSELFVLDDGMRTRIKAMKQLMVRDPSKLGGVAKTLKETRTTRELTKIAGVLVAIAAADGTIAETEEKALRALYRSLGLPTSDLASAIARTGARLERDVAVEVQAKAAGSSGVRIPPPPEAPRKLELDQAAIDAIVADTRDVAAILAEVFDNGEIDEPGSVPVPSTSGKGPAVASTPPPRASEATSKLATGLDVRYHAALEELLAKDNWADTEIRALAARHRMMPGAILDAINAWSDEVLGDFLIEEGGGWRINLELVKVAA